MLRSQISTRQKHKWIALNMPELFIFSFFFSQIGKMSKLSLKRTLGC